MRLNRIDLTRFGAFTDQTIELPGRERDFHLIVGPNEAGKSTLRSAISELLFGIGTRSPFNFVHDYNTMCLGALVSNEARELEFVRLKRNKQSLRDAADAPLPDGALTPFVGAADRAFFERMFALDHRQLEQGGLEILHAKDDVARMLFEASAGLGSLGDFRDRLEAEAKGLWDKRKSKDRTYYQALERYDAARAELKESTIRVSSWKQANQRIDAATDALHKASEALVALETERGRLERIRRVAAHLQTRRSRLEEKAELGEVIRLPEGAGEQLKAAHANIVNAEGRIRKHETLIDQFEENRDSLSVDGGLLSQREAIADLEAQRHEVRKFPADLAKRETEVETLLRGAEQLTRDLGWEVAEEEPLANRIPSKLKRAEINGLLQERGRLDQAVSGADGAVAKKNEELLALQQEIENQAEVRLPVGLASKLASARTLGDVDSRREDLRGSLQEARRSLGLAMGKLAPWSGDVEALRSLILPSDDSIREVRARHAELAMQTPALKREALNTQRDVQSRELEEQQLVRSNDPVTLGVLVESRQDRDGLWKRIRSGSESASSAGDAFEDKLEAADQLADRRYLQAGQAEKLESIRNQLQQLELKQRNQDDDIRISEEETQSLEAHWQVQMSAIGLNPMSLSAYPTWQNERDKALIAADALARAEAQHAEFESKEKGEIAGLLATLDEAGVPTPQPEDQTLAGLVAAAEERVSEAKAASARREQLQRQHAQGKNALATLESNAASAKAGMAAWTERWRVLAVPAGLPRDGATGAAQAALELLDKLAETLKEINNLRRDRIQTMERDLRSFRARTVELVTLVAPDLTSEPSDRAASLLSERFKREETSERALEQANDGLEKNGQLRDEAREQLRDAHEQIRPLLDLAQANDVETLANAIRLSDAQRKVDDAIEASTKAALQNGDGLDLDALEVEVAAEDVATLAARLEEMGHDRDEAANSRDACLLDKNQAEAARDEMRGQADAASASGRSEEALADMATAVERYVKVFVGARLLRWSIDRYREEKQDPLLSRAGEIFANLTLGSFQKLSVDYDSDTPRLLGRRADGRHTNVDGMSEATRDQLFMSLRLAAVEMHLDHASALPFIADDLFINYDDDRSKAGFKALGELARRTQVIFLTHHDHLVPVAQQVLGAEMSVIRLER